MQFDFTEALQLLGRILLGGLFAFGGIKHFFIVPILTEVMAKRGVPFPRLTLIAGSLFQIVAGVLLMANLFVVPAAFGLIVFTVIASIMFLNFWDIPAGEQCEAAKNNIAVNVGVVGGLLLAAAQAV